jgi:flavin reductase (DIM6/NTAB) family NADH-FMN oxidoreductase RutF
MLFHGDFRFFQVTGEVPMFPLPSDDAPVDKKTQHEPEPFVNVPVRDNFYQSSSFFPMPFALITTINERGTTSIGPHSLVFPFDISESHSMMLVSRASSNTATNLRRTGKCALNFVEFNQDWLKVIVDLGYPGRTPEEKMKGVPFVLAPTPTAEFSEDSDYPLIMQDAFQVYECVMDGTFEYKPRREAAAPLIENFFALRVENVLMKPEFKRKLDGRREFPDMPLSYGFRGGGEFWFAKHEQPFFIPIPREKGQTHQRIYYMANKVDPEVRFTEDACRQLIGVPSVFLEVVLNGIVDAAKAEEVRMIDTDFVKAVEAQRNQARA